MLALGFKGFHNIRFNARNDGKHICIGCLPISRDPLIFYILACPLVHSIQLHKGFYRVHIFKSAHTGHLTGNITSKNIHRNAARAFLALISPSTEDLLQACLVGNMAYLGEVFRVEGDFTDISAEVGEPFLRFHNVRIFNLRLRNHRSNNELRHITSECLPRFNVCAIVKALP